MSKQLSKTRISETIDPKLKEDATKVLSSLQLDMSTAINVFLAQVVKQNKIPFEITNETAEERRTREIKESIARGLSQAKHGEGADVSILIKEAQAQEQKLLRDENL
ncbi:type II toxin-antitoxin system RelB/DinJ family antitoxin [Secundilactobacillus malefermentans]|uniref:type II toxin-antitoxin system RelB/DinJ family antitoxin n=1 Tax=Secundilactobacillus malefermentans TaxID=176292 RepID=UPI0011CA4D6F|nr:type II toxin-antitoxin system RelB/DinJ family antitoxin [Secundilactobacillus malefermentans]QEA31363.1 type II toxin-antitoxin system RelB/DinJ family antitoxin [Secundilactobacillus malefermentans]